MDREEIENVARDLYEAGNRVFEGGAVDFRTLWKWQERLEKALQERKPDQTMESGVPA